MLQRSDASRSWKFAVRRVELTSSQWIRFVFIMHLTSRPLLNGILLVEDYEEKHEE